MIDGAHATADAQNLATYLKNLKFLSMEFGLD